MGRTSRSAAWLLAAGLTACSSDDGGPPVIDITLLGSACAPDDSCPSGMQCLMYSGFGGPLESCEVPCEQDPQDCPDGTICVTISDGPGSVCRPDSQ